MSTILEVRNTSATPVSSHLRQIPVPQVLPPTEPLAQVSSLALPGLGPTHTQGTLDLLMAGQPLPAPTQPPPAGRDLAAPRLTAGQWAPTLCQVIAEVLAGHRPPTQLLRLVSPRVYRRIRDQARPLVASKRIATASRPKVSSVHLCQPQARAAEVAAVIRQDDRARALAVRLQWNANRWVATEFEV